MNDYEQIKELFNSKFKEFEKRIEIQFKAFDRKTDRIIESQGGKNRMLDDRITRNKESFQKQLDNHCPRIRKMESNIGKMDVRKEVSDLKTKVKLNALKIATAGGAIVLAITLAFDRLASWLDKLISA